MLTVNSFRSRHVASMALKNKIAPLAAAIAFGLAGAAHAATIVVNDATAASVTGTTCTIVDAVTALNTQLPVNGCAAGENGSNTIDLTGFVTPTTISFTTSPGAQGHALALTGNAVIIGGLDSNGMPLVTLERSSVTGTPMFGLISTSATLTIDGLTLQNGSVQTYLGGAILASAALTVNNSVIRGNSSSSAGGGIASTNTVTLNNTIVSGNTAMYTGGGIQSNGSVRAYDSTISGNSTTSATGTGGGGIYAQSFVQADHATISGNTSAGKGGGIYALGNINMSNSTVSGNAAQAGPGGALDSIVGGVTLTACTVDSNTATTNGGGIYAADAALVNSTVTGNTAGGSGGGIYAHTAELSYSTIFANTAGTDASQSGIGGGLDFSTSATAYATIVYGNTPDDLNTASTTALGGSFNLVGDLTTVTTPMGTLSCDPLLGALSDNGGPTQTLPLGDGSCAIDMAAAMPTVTTDQRGYLRPAPIGDTPLSDIGAFEAGSHDPDVIFANGFE
jgi:predicted outer membrane repeat protein